MTIDYSKLSVAGIMTKDVMSVGENTTIVDLLKLFRKYHYHSYPVISQTGELVGIISEDIVLEILMFNQMPAYEHTLLSVIRSCSDVAGGIMTTHPVTVSQDASLSETADLMLKHHVHRVYVVDKGKLVGILSKRDIVNEICKRRE
jgi:CBS domain-containing protein